MNEELISIIVPVYNVQSYLKKCIESIINQTYTNLQIILIDDGSTDNCGEICDYYRKIDERILVIHQKNIGLSSSRNIGIKYACGKIIAFVDSDDYLEKTMYEELYYNMKEYNSDIAICNFNYIDNHNKIISKTYNIDSFKSTKKEKYVNLRNEFEPITCYMWNKLFKKEIFDKIKFPTGKIFEDSYIICDLLDSANTISYYLKPLYNHIFRSDSICNVFNTNHFDLVEAINNRIIFFEKKEYYDLANLENIKKMDLIIRNLTKMKKYGIDNMEIKNKYYKDLVETNKMVKWRGSTKYIKIYKLFRKPSISFFSLMLSLRYFIKK